MSRTLRVLVVDNCGDRAEAMAAMIRLWGHTCFTGTDGSRALADISALRPDVVLTELALARRFGAELSRRLRADHQFGDLLLVAIAGDREQEAWQATRETGFDYHMVEPINPDFLHDLLAHWRTRVAQRRIDQEDRTGATVPHG